MDIEDLINDLLNEESAKPKTPSDEAFALARRASRIAALFGVLSEKKSGAVG